MSGVRTVEGALDATGMRFAIVVSRFNSFITARLLEGAVDALTRLGAKPQDITVVWVPGAWELPQTSARVLEAGGHDALLALGCLMRGDTIHFELIAGEVAKGLSGLGREGDVPVIFGVLTTDTLDQAVHRAGAKHGNKGAEVATAAVEQVGVYRALAASAPAPAKKTVRASRPAAKPARAERPRASKPARGTKKTRASKKAR